MNQYEAANSVIALLIVLFALALSVWWVMCLVHALQTPEAQWVAAGQSRTTWVIVLLALCLLGSILYGVIAKPAISRARVDAGTSGTG